MGLSTCRIGRHKTPMSMLRSAMINVEYEGKKHSAIATFADQRNAGPPISPRCISRIVVKMWESRMSTSEPPRVCRRLFRLSHAAMAGWSSVAW